MLTEFAPNVYLQSKRMHNKLFSRKKSILIKKNNLKSVLCFKIFLKIGLLQVCLNIGLTDLLKTNTQEKVFIPIAK